MNIDADCEWQTRLLGDLTWSAPFGNASQIRGPCAYQVYLDEPRSALHFEETPMKQIQTREPLHFGEK